jgi:hypothetical protein
MGKTSIDQLKEKFKSGAKPSESDFSDLLDSFIHRDEDIASILIRIASISEAEQGTDNIKLMTPLLVKKAIYSLTRLSAITELANEVQAKIDTSINQLLTMDDADSLINTVKDVLDFVQGASEDLNIITELGKKVDKDMISHAIDSDSEVYVASSRAVKDVKKQIDEDINNLEYKHSSNGTIQVGGDLDIYYPVWIKFSEGGFCADLEITKNVHIPVQWDGTCYIKFQANHYFWGNNIAVCRLLTNLNSRNKFLADFRGDVNNLYGIVIWLKGARSYSYKSTIKISAINTYTESTTVGTGIQLDPKTEIDEKVNLNIQRVEDVIIN